MPIILVMVVNGTVPVIDGIFLGLFVGADALTAVSTSFPLFMILLAMSTWVGAGTASIVARQLGAERRDAASDTARAATVLALVLSICVISLYLLFGLDFLQLSTGNNTDLITLTRAYVEPLVFTSFIAALMSVRGDMARVAGRTSTVATITIVASLSNIALTGLFVVYLEMGVFGSALGSVLSQVIALCLLIIVDKNSKRSLPYIGKLSGNLIGIWKDISALGLPPAVNFFGVSMTAAAVVLHVQGIGLPDPDLTLAAYGIINRLGGFTFLPLMGLNLACQALVGQNHGANLPQRAGTALRLSLLVATLYAVIVLGLAVLIPDQVAMAFTKDPAVIAEVARLYPYVMSGFLVFSYTVLLAGYFLALGEAKIAGVLGLGKIYFFALPLLVFLPFMIGEWGVWLAGPIADFAMFAVLIALLIRRSYKLDLQFGLFKREQAGLIDQAAS